jgi:hypothetical protein
MFRDFHCYVQPTNGTVYRDHLPRHEPAHIRYEFDSYRAADLVVASTVRRRHARQGSIRWSSGTDTISQSSCSAFGPSMRKQGTVYWKLYYCTVRPSSGYAYAVVLDVTDKTSAAIRFVSYTDELPVTQTVTTPTPSSNTNNQQIVNQLLINQITNQMLRDGILPESPCSSRDSRQS